MIKFILIMFLRQEWERKDHINLNFCFVRLNMILGGTILTLPTFDHFLFMKIVIFYG